MENKELQKIADNIRKDIIKMAHVAGKKGSHVGGSLSMCEILSVLYFSVMRINPSDLESPNRDRFILSKGHGAMALYAALKNLSILTDRDLLDFKQKGSDFWTHPRFLPSKGFEFASGSLGIGISLAAGTALALKMKNSQSRVYAYIGDGECDEGSVWEAAAFSSHHNLNNLTVIVDFNQIQLDGKTSDIINKDNLGDRWEAFGFKVIYADGHDIASLKNAFSEVSSKPVAIIANTIKGKGISFMENNPIYHMAAISEKDYLQAKQELEIEDD
ncbi:MAG: transketolase [Succinatimonas sp.]|nr:transketolase [Succinatimonas sp.]